MYKCLPYYLIPPSCLALKIISGENTFCIRNLAISYFTLQRNLHLIAYLIVTRNVMTNPMVPCVLKCVNLFGFHIVLILT